MLASGQVLYEVNWSDLERAPARIPGLLAYVAALFYGSLDLVDSLSESSLEGRPRRLVVSGMARGAYRWLLECVNVGTLLAAILFLLLFILPDFARSIAAFVVGASLLLGGSRLLRSRRGVEWALRPTAVGIAAAGALVLAGTLASFGLVDFNALTRIVIRAYTVGQLAVVPALALVVLVSLLLPNPAQAFSKRALVRVGMCVLPLFLLALLGRIAWAVATQIASRLGPDDWHKRWDAWQEIYRSTTTVNLPWRRWEMAEAEFGMYAVMVGSVLVAVLVAALYVLARLVLPTRPSGAGARFGALCTIVVTIVFMAFNTLDKEARVANWTAEKLQSVCCATVESKNQEGVSKVPRDISTLYLLSMTRVLPFLLFLLPWMRPVLDVLGDVVFYQARRGRRYATKDELLSRVRVLLSSFEPDEPVVVFAHSQGSKVAIDALVDEVPPAIRLLTVGSPIRTLYDEFLGVAAPDPRSLPSVQWWENYSRHGDYIGGLIAPRPAFGPFDLPINLAATPGGHIGYWTEPMASETLRRVARASLEELVACASGDRDQCGAASSVVSKGST